MSNSLHGENDNYNYRSSNEMSLSEQLDSAQKALASAVRLSHKNESYYLKKKIIEIKKRIQQLEQLINKENMGQ